MLSIMYMFIFVIQKESLCMSLTSRLILRFSILGYFNRGYSMEGIVSYHKDLPSLGISFK